MTLDQLRIFVAVAEIEHVTRAAEALDVTQSAASAVIAALEREFGAKLFHRVGRGILLTEGGAVLLGEARDLLDRAESLTVAMSQFVGLARGRLKIRASQTIASHFLPASLVAFHRAHPGITLAVSVGNSAQVVEAVVTGEVELGFIEGSEEDFQIKLLSRDLIVQDPIVMVIGNAHPLSIATELTIGDLAALDWIVREDGSGTRSVFFKTLQMLGVPFGDLRIGIELPSNEAVLAAVIAGAGAAVLSRSVCAGALQTGSLIGLPVLLEPRPFYAVQQGDRYRTRAVAAFLAILRANVGAGGKVDQPRTNSGRL